MQDLIDHYSVLVEKHGAAKEAVAYRDEKQQITRYKAMCAVDSIPADSSVLDVGCGPGLFCDFLRSHGWQGEYTGLDITPQMVETARKHHPDDAFFCIDLLNDAFEGKFDYVFCCATLEHRPQGVEPVGYFEKMVEKMFKLVDKALVFDVFSTRVDYQDDNKIYIDPLKLMTFCYDLTPRMVIRNDCRPYEMMVYLYKNTAKDKLNIFNELTLPDPLIAF